MILNDPAAKKDLLFQIRNENSVVEIEKEYIPEESRIRWEDLTVFKDESNSV
jgi:hypothetical protein